MRMLVTGHAGFKGGWLVHYANARGHTVGGYGLSRTAGPSFYEAARVRDRLAFERRGDVTDTTALREAMDAFRPDAVLHLAARAIVTESLDNPVGTIRTNVVGTAAVLEAVRHTDSVAATVVVTTDKVYRNDGRESPYSETDRLGGLDPYGASKAAAEMIVDGYRATYGLNVATARSGNAIGGGDWGPRRLVPTCLDAFWAGKEPTIYDATRPFLHVLDSIRGYVLLAERLYADSDAGGAYNFGPPEASPLYRVADHIADRMGGSYERAGAPPREAQYLALDCAKSHDSLAWRPLWGTEEALDHTVGWYVAWREGSDMELVTMEQVHAHQAAT